MFRNDKTNKTEGRSNIIWNLTDASAKLGKKFTTIVSKPPGRALENGAKNGNAAVSKQPEPAPSSLPDVTNFYRTGKRFSLRELP